MLSRLGLRVVRGPALGTVMLTDEGPLRAVTAELIERPPDYLVANTGIGIRSWLGAAQSWGLDAELLRALGGARVAARGPKVAGAVRSAGLALWWRAPTEQLAEVGAHLIAEGVAGCRVAIQRHGQDDPGLASVLQGAGAEVVEVPVYRWAVPTDHEPALRLIEAVIDGEIDAVTFTSGPAIRNLMALARDVGAGEDLLGALNAGVIVACVGPVCAGVAAEEGIARTVVPEHWRLGAMVTRLAEELRLRAPA